MLVTLTVCYILTMAEGRPRDHEFRAEHSSYTLVHRQTEQSIPRTHLCTDRRRTIELTHIENDGCIHNTHTLYQTDESDGYNIFNIQFALPIVAFSNFKMALQQIEPLILPDTSPFCHRC